MDTAYKLAIFLAKREPDHVISIKLIFNSYFSKRECHIGPSERWFMLKNRNSSYFVQRHFNIL